MGDVAISAVINKIVDIGATWVVEEFSRLYGLPREIKWLERQMRLMQAYLKVAEEKKVVDPMVQPFIEDIRDLANDVEDIFDIFLSEIYEHKSSSLLKRITCIMPYSVTCSKLSREIEKIRNRVRDIEEDKQIHNIPDINLPAEAECLNMDPRTTTLDADDSLIVGFDDHIKTVKAKLEKYQYVTIVGMAGLGKTTLAKKVFNGVKGDFQCNASVSVSRDPIINSLWQDIAKQVGLEEEKRGENLEVNLKSLLQEKRYILLLDDVWSTDVWDQLRKCFPINLGHSDSRIIITSRHTDVGRNVGCKDSLHFLHSFDETTSWELFSKSIIPFFNTVEEFEHSELKKIGERIVEKCGGVPLAIVLIVGLLRKREKTEFCWNDVLNNIGHPTDKCFEIFSLSYVDLPLTLKPCFLYLGSFPEDYEYSAFKLIRMWVAEKLVVGIPGRQPEDVGWSYMNELDSRNLIQVVRREVDGRVKKFRVHDLLYSLCVKKGREIDFLNTNDRIDPVSARKVRRLSTYGDENILQCDMPKIRALFDFGFELDIQEKLLKRILDKSRLLRMLTIQIQTTIPTSLFLFHLPRSVGSLSCLNYLQINSEWGVEIPLSIQNLKYLETLIVRARSSKIPVGIWKMEQLKHLHLKVLILEYHKCDYFLQLKLGPLFQVSLPNIQTLYLPCPLKTHPKYSHMLPNFTILRKLTLKDVTHDVMKVLCGREPISNNLETLYYWGWYECRGMRINLSKYGMLKNLSINFFGRLDLHDHDFPPSLIRVSLSRFNISYATIATLKKLPKLKILELGCPFMESKLDCSGGFFQLEVLKIDSPDDLEELIEGEGEEIGMPKLRQFITENCCDLKTIPERLQRLRAQTN